MKLSQNENMSEEEKAILIQLARRHTMAEARRVGDVEENRRKTSRAKSLEGFDDLEDKPPEKLTNLSGAPTVITESELASSRLYKDRKAKINSDEEDIDKPKSNSSSDDPVNCEPRHLYDPNLRPVPVPMKPRREKFSSCCCYFLVILIISLASLGVMAAIGGVIYMELFAVYKESLDIPVTEIPISSDMMHLSLQEKNFPHTTDENVILSEKEIPNKEKFSVDGIQNSKKSSPDLETPLRENKILHETMSVAEKSLVNNESDNDSEKLFNNIESNKETNSNLDPPIKEIDKSSLNELSRNIQSLDEKQKKFVSDKPSKLDTISQINKKFGNMGEVNQGRKVLVSEKISRNPNVASGDERKMNENRSISAKSQETQLLDSNMDIISAIIKNLSDSNKNVIVENFKLKLDSFNTSETLFEEKPRSSGSSIHNRHLAENSSTDVTNTIEQGTSNLFNLQQNISEESMKNDTSGNYDFDASHKEILENNTTHLEELNKSEVFEQNSSEMNIQNKDLVDHDFNETDQNLQVKNISKIEEKGLNNSDSSDSSQLMLIHPVVESRAVPVPVEFLRRLGFDIKNTKNHQPLNAKDMEIKFSLAEALKYLRSLDSENKLPTSRQKINNRNVTKSKNPEPINNVERKEYLKNLRRKLFEEKREDLKFPPFKNL